MGEEVFLSPSRGDAFSKRKRNFNSNSVTLAVFLSGVLFTLVVLLVDKCEGQQLSPEHRGDPDGGVGLGDYEDDDGVVPILNHRSGIQHEDVLTALPNHYYVPNSQYAPSPIYNGNGTGGVPSTVATPEAGTTSAAGKDGKDFTPPNDIVRGFKPVYPDDARFVSITTSTVGPPPKRRKKVKRVKGQQAQQPQAAPQGQFQPQQPPQGFQNSFGFQPNGPGGYMQPHPHGHGGNGGPYFAAANQYYSFTAGDSQNGNASGHVAFPNDTTQHQAGFSTLYSTNPAQQSAPGQEYQQQTGPFLSSGMPLTGAPGFPPHPNHGQPFGHPPGPPRVNPLKKLANMIRGKPRPPHPGHPQLPPQGPPFQGLPPQQQGQQMQQPGPMNQQQQQQQQYGPGQHPGGPQQQQPFPPHQGPGFGPRYPPYNPAHLQHQQQQYLLQQQQWQQQMLAQQQNQNQTQNGNGTQISAASSNVPVGFPANGNFPGYMGNAQGQFPGGPNAPPRPGGPPNISILSKLNFNTYIKKFSNMFNRGPPPPGAPLGVPPGAMAKNPAAAPGSQAVPNGPPPQQKVPQQMLYPHYYPMNSYAPNGPNTQAEYQQQLQQQQQQQMQPGANLGNNQIRRRRIKVRKNGGMDPRNRKVDDAPEALDQKELIGRPRLAGQNDDMVSEDDMELSPGMNDPNQEENGENGGGRRRKRLATISSIATPTSSSSDNADQSASSGYRMPGIFGMDSGKAFYLDKDPKTGDITFNAPASQSGEAPAQNNGGSTSPSSNELSPDSKYKPVIIHSYSSTKNQGGLSTYKRPNLSSLNNKFKAKRPTFFKFNKTSTLAPPRLPSFYVPSTTQFQTTSTSTTTTTPVPLPGSEEGSTSAKTEFPNVIVAKSSSEVVTRVSMSSSSSVTSSKEVSGPQYKKKAPVKFPLFKHTTPSTTTSTSSTTTEKSTTLPTTTAEVITSTLAQLEEEPTPSSTTTTTTEPTSTTMFYDPYLPFELLNLQRQVTTTTTTTTTTQAPTTTEEVTTTTTTTQAPTTTVDPYTIPPVVKVETTTTQEPTSLSTVEPSSTVAPTAELPAVSPSDSTTTNKNGSSLLPTGPEVENADQSQEQEEDEDYYYDNPDQGQGYGMVPGGGAAPGQFNSFGQYRPGAMPPHAIPGGYYNPMMGGGHQGRPPVVPMHGNNMYNSFNPFGPPGYYPGYPNQPQNIQGVGGGYYNPDAAPPHGVPTASEAAITEESTTIQTTATSPTTTASSTTTPTTTTSQATTTTTTTEVPTTVSTTEAATTTTTITPTSSPAPTAAPDAELMGETEMYDYEDEVEGDSAVLPSIQQTQQQPANSFHLPPLPPQPPKRPQPPLPPHRRPPPPPPFINRLPPMYFNNQRPPPVRPGSTNFPFRPPPPVKEVMKTSEAPKSTSTSTTTSTTTTTIPTTTTTTTTTTVPTTTTTTTTTTTQPPTTSTTTTTTEAPLLEEEEETDSLEGVNQDLFIPPEQLLAYTPSPDRVQDSLPDEVIQDIAPGFDLFNVQWGQKVPPPSSHSYSSHEQQAQPFNTLSTTTTTAVPPTARIISRNVTEVNINGTDYIYEYIDEIIEEDVPVGDNSTSNAAPVEGTVLHQQPLPSGGPPQQFYNPYEVNPYNGFVAMGSTPSPFNSQAPFLLPNGQPAWIQPQQPYPNEYYVQGGVPSTQYTIQGIDGSQQFIPVGSGFNPSSIAPSPTPASEGPSSPQPTHVAGSHSHEILSASPSSIHPPLHPVTENTVDGQQFTNDGAEDLSESYIVSLIDPSKNNGTGVSPIGGLGSFISSTTEGLEAHHDSREHSKLILSSTAGTPAPVVVSQTPSQVSSTTTTAPPASSTADKLASYEYVDYPEGDELTGVGSTVQELPPASQAGDKQHQQPQQQPPNPNPHNIQSLQMMLPPPPLPPHLQQQQQQQQPQQHPQIPQGGPPPHGHPQKKKPSSFLQNLFGKLRPGQSGPPPQGSPPNGHLPYPHPQGFPPHVPQLNKNYLSDSVPAGSAAIGVHSPPVPGSGLLPPIMIPNGQDKFNMDSLFGARNGTVADDSDIQPPPQQPTRPSTTTTTSTTTHPPSISSSELGSDEEDEVIYVTPEELAKLKETGQVDDFELVEDEDEYEYEDEPENDLTSKKLARSDTKPVLGHNETNDISSSTLLKKTAPVAQATEAASTQQPSTTQPTTTTTTTTTTLPPSTAAPARSSVEVKDRKQDYGSGPHPYSHTQQLGQHQQPSFPQPQGMFQMRPPTDFGRPHQVSLHQPLPQQHYSQAPPQHHMQQHHMNRMPAPPPTPYRTIPQSATSMTQFQHRHSNTASSSVGGTHYNANIGQIGAPPNHFYNPLASSGLPSTAINTPLTATSTSVAEKRQDTHHSSKYDYDDSIEVITAGPQLDPNVPRDIVVKSSFNTASGAGAPKSKSMSAQASSAPHLSQGGTWQGGVEKVTSLTGDASGSSSFLQKHHSFSEMGRALPNHFDKNAHMRQLQLAAQSSSSRGNRNMSGGSTSSSSRQYRGYGF